MRPLCKNWSCQEWSEQNGNTGQDYRGGEDVHKTNKTFYFEKLEKYVEQDQHEDKNQNIIRSIKKLDTPYNTVSTN